MAGSQGVVREPADGAHGDPGQWLGGRAQGRAYPEAAAYGAYPGVPVQAVVPLQYAILAGQRYAVQDATIVTDYYRAVTFDGTPPSDHVDIRGADTYYQVSLGHRTAFVRAADVDLVPAT